MPHGRRRSAAAVNGDDDSDARQRELKEVFVSVTGTEVITEDQEQHTTSERVLEGSSVSERVTDVAKADGLSDES